MSELALLLQLAGFGIAAVTDKARKTRRMVPMINSHLFGSSTEAQPAFAGADAGIADEVFFGMKWLNFKGQANLLKFLHLATLGSAVGAERSFARGVFQGEFR